MRSHHHIWVQVLVNQIVLNDWGLDAAAWRASAGLNHTIIHEIRRDAGNRVQPLCNM